LVKLIPDVLKVKYRFLKIINGNPLLPGNFFFQSSATLVW